MSSEHIMHREKTISRILAGVEGDEVTSVASVLKLIKSLSGNVEGRDIESLTEAIGTDVSLSAKVIRAAQPMRYNPEGVLIESIDQAIHMIGLNKISSLSMALLMAQDMEGENPDPLIVEILSISVFSGCLARLFSQQAGFQDNELCFASGLFQSYGDLLLARFMPSEYREANVLALRQKITKQEAIRQTFGLTSAELAKAVFKKIKVPSSIWKTIKGFDFEELIESKEELNEVSVAGTFSQQVSEIVNSRGIQLEQFNTKIDKLLGRFSKSTGVDREAFDKIMAELHEELENLRTSGGIPKFSQPLKDRLRIIAAGTDDPLPDAPRCDIPQELAKSLFEELRNTDEIESVDDYENSEVAPSRVAKSKLFFHTGIENMVGRALSKDTLLESIVSQICETVIKGFKSRNVYFFTPSMQHSGFFLSIFSQGPETSEQTEIASFSIADESFLAEAVIQKKPILVHRIAELSREYSIKNWMKPQLKLSPHIAWPLVYKKEVIAMVLMNGGDEYTSEEFEIGTNQMSKFFKFAALCYATKQLPLAKISS